MKRALVIGAGAVGVALATALQRAGCRVELIARPHIAPILRERGIARRGLFGEWHVPASELGVVEELRLLGAGSRDVVLVCCKAFDSELVAKDLADVWARLGEDCLAVLFHNGWGSADLFAARLARERVFSARVITGFRLLEPGLTEITVHQDAIRLGSLFGADPARMQPLAEALTRGGVPAVVSPNISSDLLAKLLYNCALNPLGALLGVRYGALADDPESREIMNAVVAEIFAVLGAAGLTTSWPDAPAYLADFYARLIPPTASHESSMLQDLRGGRRTEIDFLSGAVARLGRTWGVATPVNTALLALVRAAEQRGRA